MSFSEQRRAYANLPQSQGVTQREKEYLASGPAKLNEDHAVELLVDDIRRCSCHFRFKEPLGKDFFEARNNALNCLEMGKNVPPRKVHHWVSDCLKCMDVMLFVYLRDVLKSKVSGKSARPKERDVYDTYEGTCQTDLKTVGAQMNAIYQKRSDPFEHHQLFENGERRIRPPSNKKLCQAFEFVHRSFVAVLDVMVPRYRAAFSEHCTDCGLSAAAEQSASGTS